MGKIGGDRREVDTYQAALPGSLSFVLRALGTHGCDPRRGDVDLNFRLTIWLFGRRWNSEELIMSSGQFLDNIRTS